jgi:hypothetical protein
LNQNLGRLVGGPLGGLLLAASGLPVIVLVDLATFVAAAILIAGVAREPALGGRRSRKRPIVCVRWHQIRIGLVIAALAGIAQGIFVVLFVVWVARELDGGATEIGLLRGVQAIGSMAAGLLLATSRRTPRPATLVAAGAGGFGAILFALWNGPLVTTALVVYVVLFIVVGVPALAIITGLVSVLQQETIDETRGRVFGIFGTVYDASSATGMLAAGLLAGRVGLTATLNIQGALYIAAGAAALMFLRNGTRPHTKSKQVGRIIGSPATP